MYTNYPVLWDPRNNVWSEIGVEEIKAEAKRDVRAEDALILSGICFSCVGGKGHLSSPITERKSKKHNRLRSCQAVCVCAQRKRCVLRRLFFTS